ncbi:MAG TPA: hypothetical protein VNP04_02090 [Alphaproteobacteria bacterium]|nr:hypothetical protein [Alphaproteobacteria bacterium]
MSQQVIVTTDAPVALKPLLESAIRSELRMLELGLARTSQRLHAFEHQYGLTSEEFERRFAAGGEESLDYIEWAGEIKTYHLLKAQQQALQRVQLH